jgi:hypothetical protein
MGQAAGWVLAAGAVSLGNEALFAPLATGGTPFQSINWRVIPAAGVLAAVLTGLEKLAPKFGAGLGMLVFLSVLVIPYGKAPTPLQSLSSALGYSGGAIEGNAGPAK